MKLQVAQSLWCTKKPVSCPDISCLIFSPKCNWAAQLIEKAPSQFWLFQYPVCRTNGFFSLRERCSTQSEKPHTPQKREKNVITEIVFLCKFPHKSCRNHFRCVAIQLKMHKSAPNCHYDLSSTSCPDMETISCVCTRN